MTPAQTGCGLRRGNFLARWLYSTGQDGTATANTNCSFVNNALHSCIKTIKMWVNNTIVFPEDDSYSKMSYFQTALNFSGEQEDSYLELQGWKTDTSGHFDSLLVAEYTGLAGSRNVYGAARRMFIGMPILDLFKTDRVLPPGAKITVQVYFNKPELCFISEDAGNNTCPKLGCTRRGCSLPTRNRRRMC